MALETRVLHQWGYRNQPFQVDKLEINFRPNTTDEKVIDEVLIKHAYQKKKIGFLIEPDDIWLDLGANIGTFSLLVAAAGGKSIAVEPESDNLMILKKNLQPFKSQIIIVPACVSTTDGTTKLYLCNGSYNKYRHSMHLTNNRTRQVVVPKIGLDTILKRYSGLGGAGAGINAIKMDIEGEEITLLEWILEKPSRAREILNNINKLVFEYSFDVDPSVARFFKIIDGLTPYFNVIHYTKVKRTDKEYKFFPPCVNVFCLK